MNKKVITAFADPCSGPGWSNRPIIVILQDDNGKLSLEYLQPEEQSRDMWVMYDISATASKLMRLEAEAVLTKRGKNNHEHTRRNKNL